MTTTTPLDLAPHELVRRVQLAIVKARSNSAEAGTLELGELMQPRVYGTEDPLALLPMTQHVLSRGDAAVTAHDAWNVLAAARRLETFDLLYFLRWEEDPPESLEYLAAAMRREDEARA